MTTTWQEEQQTRRSVTVAIATDVAAELGFTVDTDPAFDEYRVVYLDGPDGERIAVGLDWKDADRVTVAACFPPNDVYGIATPEIGVGLKRGPQVIAREITRRLLPTYRELLAKVRESNADRDAARAKRNDAAVQLRTILPGAQVRSEDKSNHTEVLFYSSGAPSGSVRVNYRATEAEMTLRSVPLALALDIARLIRDAQDTDDCPNGHGCGASHAK